MRRTSDWDFLILSAANELQAESYRHQLDTRARLGLLAGVTNTLVVADPPGKRIGSGGSTCLCLMRVLEHEALNRPNKTRCGEGREDQIQALASLRILIIHAGGDARRLPAYGPIGKLFTPLPGNSQSALWPTIFDRLLETYVGLPRNERNSGQIVVTSGDVLLEFVTDEVSLNGADVVGLALPIRPEQASRHGVFVARDDDTISEYLQKPSVEKQLERQAVGVHGESLLDVGVFQINAPTAGKLLGLCATQSNKQGQWEWSGEFGTAIETHGFDFYREFCCALGTQTEFRDYLDSVRRSGGNWSDALLLRFFQSFRQCTGRVELLSDATFLHFGTTRQIIESGETLARRGARMRASTLGIRVNNDEHDELELTSGRVWLEACHLAAPISMQGMNVVVGADIQQPLHLAEQECLDIVPLISQTGHPRWAVRVYRADDKIQSEEIDAIILGGWPLREWMRLAKLEPSALWSRADSKNEHIGFNAKIFPVVDDPAEFYDWLWMHRPGQAAKGSWQRWSTATRVSSSDLIQLADQSAMHHRRLRFRIEQLITSARERFLTSHELSAADIAYLFDDCALQRDRLMAALLERIHWQIEHPAARHRATSQPRAAFASASGMHMLGTALIEMRECEAPCTEVFPVLPRYFSSATEAWLDQQGLAVGVDESCKAWGARLCKSAFDRLRKRIVTSSNGLDKFPQSVLRTDEIVWGRAPARIDLTGGWTDTPPYSLEHGGRVLNASVDLNGQPPIQAYARVTSEPQITLRSIDVGSQFVLRTWEDLLDTESATGEFSLVKAALSLAGFAAAHRVAPSITLGEALQRFGGGLEISTLAAIPKGSGLGTSSIMGSVLLSVIYRVLGIELSSRDLFHGVLKLEQMLTTGGGWQDQIGGSLGGLKLITTAPSLIPNAVVRYVPEDVVDPHINGGRTLLYYTGITRLAKNILQQVVGRYLDRDRMAVRVLAQLKHLVEAMTETVGRKDFEGFGRLIDEAWELNKKLDPSSTNPDIEHLLSRIRPHIEGAKLLGAGGGGFLLLVCKSQKAAEAVRIDLQQNPPNERARFFDFSISKQGLAVSVC